MSLYKISASASAAFGTALGTGANLDRPTRVCLAAVQWEVVWGSGRDTHAAGSQSNDGLATTPQGQLAYCGRVL